LQVNLPDARTLHRDVQPYTQTKCIEDISSPHKLIQHPRKLRMALLFKPPKTFGIRQNLSNMHQEHCRVHLPLCSPLSNHVPMSNRLVNIYMLARRNVGPPPLILCPIPKCSARALDSRYPGNPKPGSLSFLSVFHQLDEVSHDEVGRRVRVAKPDRVGAHADVSRAADVRNAPPWDASCEDDQPQNEMNTDWW